MSVGDRFAESGIAADMHDEEKIIISTVLAGQGAAGRDRLQRSLDPDGQAAVSPKARVRIGREIRSRALHQRSDKSLENLAAIYNPTIRGWNAYHNHFYRTQLRPPLYRIDAHIVRWACREYKRMARRTDGAKDWLVRLRRATPRLFAHWQLCYGSG